MATLTVTGRSDLAGVSADVDDVAASVRSMGDDIARVDDVARTSSGGIDALADASDNAASRSSQAAGGLGDLAGGLEAIGATGAAGALEGVSLAAQTAVGAGDILNLVAETTAGKFVLQTAATVAARAAHIAGAAATGVMTVAQAGLNLVMSANPIALVVIAIAALVAGLVIAYKNSETFRNIIDGAFTTAKNVVGAAADAVGDIVGWFVDLPGKVRDAAGTVKENVTNMFEPVETAIEWVGDLVSDLVSKPGDAVQAVKDNFALMFAPILTAVGWVEDIIEKLKNIDIPDLNPFGDDSVSLPPSSRVAGPTVPTSTTTVTIPITIQGAIDPDGTARTIIEVLTSYLGRTPDFTSITVGS